MENIRSWMCLYYQSTDLKIYLFCKLQILLKIYFLPSRKANFESIYKQYVFTHIIYN